jgi:hypothetical protein
LTKLKYQRPSISSGFNKQKNVYNDKQKDLLLKELDIDDTEWMINCFNNHCKMMSTGREYISTSGLSPVCILSVHLYIQRFSPTFLEESDTESEKDD